MKSLYAVVAAVLVVATMAAVASMQPQPAQTPHPAAAAPAPVNATDQNATVAVANRTIEDAWDGSTTGTGAAQVTSDPHPLRINSTMLVRFKAEDSGSPGIGPLHISVRGASGSWDGDGGLSVTLEPGSYNVTVGGSMVSASLVRAWHATANGVSQ